MFGGNINPAAGPKPPQPGPAQPGPEAPPQAAGDGFHHFTADENESGIHSTHIGPDGQQTDADHATVEEAAQQMQQCMGGQGDDQQDQDPGADMPDDSGSEPGPEQHPDFSAAYSK